MLEVATGISSDEVKETNENTAQKTEINLITQCFQHSPFNDPTKEETTKRLILSDKEEKCVYCKWRLFSCMIQRKEK